MKTMYKNIPTHPSKPGLPPVGRGWVWVLLLLLVISSCRDHYDLDKLDNPSKMVVYCFPSTEDTTFISVTTSVGVKKYTDTHQIRNLSEAHITYTVNSEAHDVQQTEDGRFFVLGQHQSGDLISIRAEHPDYGVAEATATVPEAVPVELQKVVAVKEYDPDYYEARDFHKLLATFTDPAATEDYYAVRVVVRKCYTPTDSITLWPQVVTNDEPLLNPLSDIDSNFGFGNDYYDNFYIFSDSQINGQTYTLHLNISAYLGEYEYKWGNECFQVVLYHISPAFYHFLKSYNDVANNELAQGGFAQVAPIQSNIQGGLGLLGTYAAWRSNWRTLDE